MFRSVLWGWHEGIQDGHSQKIQSIKPISPILKKSEYVSFFSEPPPPLGREGGGGGGGGFARFSGHFEKKKKNIKFMIGKRAKISIPHSDPNNFTLPHTTSATYFFPPFFFCFFCGPFPPAPPTTGFAALITPSLPAAFPPPLVSAPFSPTPPCVKAAALARPFLPLGRYEARSLTGSQRSGSGVLAGS